LSWNIDPHHLQVEFSAKHLGMMTVRGHFTEISTTGNLDPHHPEASSVEITIQVATIRTHNEIRDNDLRSSNFLEVDKYPTITFQSTQIEPVGEERFNMTGDLTIKGTTRPITLPVTRYGELNDPMMGHRMAYSAETEINRRDFGLTRNMLLDGRWVVSNEVKIMVELVEQKQEQATAVASA
jgi:polyisoprenoid-binding protein YceI